jgi:hypothetical protein
MLERFCYIKMEKEATPEIGDQSQLQASIKEQYFVE